MAERKTFLVRLDPQMYEALQRWADGELRSVNAQIEFALRGALRDAGRLPSQEKQRGSDSDRATRAERGTGAPASERDGGIGGAEPPNED